MSKHDLQARPIYHQTRESIEAHLAKRKRPDAEPCRYGDGTCHTHSQPH